MRLRSSQCPIGARHNVTRITTVLTLTLGATTACSGQAPYKVLVLPVERYTLPNGLTVLLTVDHSSPTVGLEVGYHVGSKDERPGRTGFAHLFEHVMFQGSQHIPYGLHFKMIENAGGSPNASTETDETVYEEVFPSNALERVLWLESDRMGFLLPTMDQAKLDAQRAIVKNERRQIIDKTYGEQEEVLLKALFPATNSYSWSTIGSMADLSAASLEDVKQFFRTYYVPNNATLSIAGDFDRATVKRWIVKYFGAIPAGAAVTHPTLPLVTLPAEKRLVLEDRSATLPKLTIAWPTVGEDHPDHAALSALARLLSTDRIGQLNKLLVYDRQLATSASASANEFENGGYFSIDVIPRPTVSLTEIERVVDSALTTLAVTPPTDEEMHAVKQAARVHSVLDLDGALTQADLVLNGQLFHHDPLSYVTMTNQTLALTAGDVMRVARTYLTQGRVVLSMIPAGKLDQAAKPAAAYTNVTPAPEVQQATAPASEPGHDDFLRPSAFDTNQAPRVPPATAMTFPVAKRRVLANGIPVIVMEDHHLPAVSVTTVLRLSPALEPPGKTGISGIMRAMLKEGTTTQTAAQLAEAGAKLGSTVSPFSFYTIDANVTPALALMADQLLHPTFPEAALTRLKANTAGQIRDFKGNPQYLANQTFAAVVYGKTHPYARTATEAETQSITRDDIVRFYTTYVRPPNVTFVVAGDITPDRAVAELNRAFGTWPRGQSGHVDVPPPSGVSSTAIYLYDRPGSAQSRLVIGNVGPRHDTPDLYAVELMNTAFGGTHTSRLTANLRERHGYAYTVRSTFQFRRVPELGTFAIRTGVATSKTDSALIQAMQEIHDMHGTRPLTPQELAFAQSKTIGELPLQFETAQDRAHAVAQLVEDSLPLDYYSTLIPRYQSVTLEQARAAGAKYIDPDKLAIVVVGDRAAIEPKLRAAKIAPIVLAEPIP